MRFLQFMDAECVLVSAIKVMQSTICQDGVEKLLKIIFFVERYIYVLCFQF